MDTRYEARVGAPGNDTGREARSSTAALPILIGSLAVIVGCFLEWASVSTDAASRTAAGDFNGYNLPDGRIVMGIGVALLVIAALMWANRRVGSWFDADLLGVALSAIAAVTVVTFLMDVGSAGRSAEIGTYVALGGALIAFVGAIAALLRSGSDRATAGDDARGDVERRIAA